MQELGAGNITPEALKKISVVLKKEKMKVIMANGIKRAPVWIAKILLPMINKKADQ